MCDIQKPIVFTTTEERETLIDKINNFLSHNVSQLSFDNGDVFFCKNKLTVPTSKKVVAIPNRKAPRERRSKRRQIDKSNRLAFLRA